MRTLGVFMILLGGMLCQTTLFPFLNVGGYQPDLVLMTLLVIGVFFPVREAWKYGLFIGLLKDLLFGRSLGVYALVYLLTILAISSLAASIFKENVMAPLLMFPVGLIGSNGLLLLIRYLLGTPGALSLYGTTWSLGYWLSNLAGMILMYALFKRLRQRGYLLDVGH